MISQLDRYIASWVLLPKCCDAKHLRAYLSQTQIMNFLSSTSSVQSSPCWTTIFVDFSKSKSSVNYFETFPVHTVRHLKYEPDLGQIITGGQRRKILRLSYYVWKIVIGGFRVHRLVLVLTFHLVAVAYQWLKGFPVVSSRFPSQLTEHLAVGLLNSYPFEGTQFWR